MFIYTIYRLVCTDISLHIQITVRNLEGKCQRNLEGKLGKNKSQVSTSWLRAAILTE